MGLNPIRSTEIKDKKFLNANKNLKASRRDGWKDIKWPSGVMAATPV